MLHRPRRPGALFSAPAVAAVVALAVAAGVVTVRMATGPPDHARPAAAPTVSGPPVESDRIRVEVAVGDGEQVLRLVDHVDRRAGIVHTTLTTEGMAPVTFVTAGSSVWVLDPRSEGTSSLRWGRGERASVPAGAAGGASTFIGLGAGSTWSGRTVTGRTPWTGDRGRAVATVALDGGLDATVTVTAIESLDVPLPAALGAR